MTATSRLIVLNTVFAAALMWASVLGYVQFVFVGDKSGASYLVALTLAATIVAAFRGKTASLQDATMVCGALGLFGTFIGFASSMYGIDAAQMFSHDGLLDLAGRIVSGMPTALCSSIAGLVAGLWIGCMGWIVGVRAWPC
jgi:hypothetical protein